MCYTPFFRHINKKERGAPLSLHTYYLITMVVYHRFSAFARGFCKKIVEIFKVFLKIGVTFQEEHFLILISRRRAEPKATQIAVILSERQRVEGSWHQFDCKG